MEKGGGDLALSFMEYDYHFAVCILVGSGVVTFLYLVNSIFKGVRNGRSNNN